MISNLYLAAGVVVGGGCRYLAWLVANRAVGRTVRWGTPLINIIGSVVLGFLSVMTLPDGLPPASAAMGRFFMVGICSGFATVSFGLQTLELLLTGTSATVAINVLNAIVLTIAAVVLCIIAATLGHAIAICIGAEEWAAR